MTEEDAFSRSKIIAIGEQALGELRKHFDSPLIAPICHHFSPESGDYDDDWGTDCAYCVRARQIFDALEHGEFDELGVDYVGGSSGIEAWEDGWPTIEWLNFRVTQMIEVADKAGLIYQGWSFEPRQGPFIAGTVGVNVYRAGTQEADEAIAAIQGRAADEAEEAS